MKNSFWLLSLSVLLAVSSCGRLEDGTYRVDIFSTNDVHGKYYDLAKVSSYIGSEREALGEDNVLLIDVGDILQGDNAAYYFNYVDTVSEHIYAKAARYMKQDGGRISDAFLGGQRFGHKDGEGLFPGVCHFRAWRLENCRHRLYQSEYQTMAGPFVVERTPFRTDSSLRPENRGQGNRQGTSGHSHSRDAYRYRGWQSREWGKSGFGLSEYVGGCGLRLLCP